MGRGQGLENIKEYDWVKQPNGRYTIFDVPIFETFFDENRGVGGQKVTKKDLQKAVTNFIQNKIKRFHYPRIHVGHHNGPENQPGAGYLDNLHLKGGTVFSDLVEIIPEIFEQQIAEMKFPYVSAEYNSETKQIISLALLESQSPYFKFPILALSKNPKEPNFFQKQFGYWKHRSDFILQFQERSKPVEEEKVDKEKQPPEKEEKQDFCEGSSGDKEPMVEDKSKNYNCQEEMGGLRETLQKILASHERTLALVEEIYEWEKSEHEGGMEGEMPEDQPEEDFEDSEDSEEKEPSAPIEEEEDEMGKPSSVAYQKYTRVPAKWLSEVQKEISGIKENFASQKKQNKLQEAQGRLRQICNTCGLNFAAESANLSKFSSAEDAEIYLNALEKVQPPVRHPASRMVAKFAEENPKEGLLKKFSQDQKSRRRAEEAYQTYQDTIEAYEDDPRQLKSFQTDWPTAEKFVKFCVANPKEYQRMIGK